MDMMRTNEFLSYKFSGSCKQTESVMRINPAIHLSNLSGFIHQICLLFFASFEYEGKKTYQATVIDIFFFFFFSFLQ
jgi:hypothetical protein